MCVVLWLWSLFCMHIYINVRVNLTGAKLQFMQQLYRLDWLILRFIGLYYYMYIECALLFPFYYVAERVCVCMLFCVFFCLVSDYTMYYTVHRTEPTIHIHNKIAHTIR